VVLDEVDILYDDQEFTEVLRTLEQAASKRVQYVHVTATLPVDIHDSLLTRYPDAIPLMGPTLHRTAVGLQEVVISYTNTLPPYVALFCQSLSCRLHFVFLPAHFKLSVLTTCAISYYFHGTYEISL